MQQIGVRALDETMACRSYGSRKPRSCSSRPARRPGSRTLSRSRSRIPLGCAVGTIGRLHPLAFPIEPADGHVALPKLPWLINFLGDGQASAQRLLCFIPMPAHPRALALHSPCSAFKLSRPRGDGDLQALIGEPIRGRRVSTRQRQFAQADVAVRRIPPRHPSRWWWVPHDLECFLQFLEMQRRGRPLL